MLCREGARHIIEYSKISRKSQGTTVASVLYEGDLYHFLRDAFPMGASFPLIKMKFLSSIAIPIAMALCDLHGRGLVHLDLKSENILLSKEKVAYLGDFGGCQKEFSYETTEISTPIIAAPETFLNGGAWVARPSLDMWAFGLLLTDLFLGVMRNPVFLAFDRNANSLSLEEKFRRITLHSAEIINAFTCFLSLSNPPVDRSVCRLVILLLCNNPWIRPTAREVLDELCALRKELSV
jgi:serine/threonine protein kinase